MSAGLDPRQWQQLSEYLDHQLDEKQMARVERMLVSSPEWQEGLQSLRNTRAALRAAPSRRAPRNFTLSAAQAAKIRKPTRVFWLFRLSSAVSTAMAVIFVVLGFVLQAAPASAPMMAAAPAMEKSADQAVGATSVPIIIWGPPEMNQYLSDGQMGAASEAYGKGGGGGGYGGDGGVAPETMTSQQEADLPAAEAPVQETQNDALALAPPAPAMDFLAEPAPTSAEPAPETRELIPESNPILGLQTTGENDSVAESDEIIAPEPMPTPDKNPSGLPVWWTAAALMLALAVITGYLGWRSTGRH